MLLFPLSSRSAVVVKKQTLRVCNWHEDKKSAPYPSTEKLGSGDRGIEAIFMRDLEFRSILSNNITLPDYIILEDDIMLEIS